MRPDDEPADIDGTAALNVVPNLRGVIRNPVLDVDLVVLRERAPWSVKVNAK